jgi:hypothetical protein
MFVGMKYAGLASQESSFPDSEAKKNTPMCHRVIYHGLLESHENDGF